MSSPDAAPRPAARASGRGKFLLDLIILIGGHVPVMLAGAAVGHYGFGWSQWLAAVIGVAAGVPLGGRLAHRIQQALEKAPR
mgnify:CR=1 FL=1